VADCALFTEAAHSSPLRFRGVHENGSRAVYPRPLLSLPKAHLSLHSAITEPEVENG
jgi:hypothetical protein